MSELRGDTPTLDALAAENAELRNLLVCMMLRLSEYPKYPEQDRCAEF